MLIGYVLGIPAVVVGGVMLFGLTVAVRSNRFEARLRDKKRNEIPNLINEVKTFRAQGKKLRIETWRKVLTCAQEGRIMILGQGPDSTIVALE